MATKYFCDRCHVEAEQAAHLHRIDIPSTTRVSAYAERQVELCDRCLIGLHQWAQPQIVAREG